MRGALGEQRLFGGEVVHVGAVRWPGERELVAEVGLQPGQIAGRARRGGCEQSGAEEHEQTREQRQAGDPGQRLQWRHTRCGKADGE